MAAQPPQGSGADAPGSPSPGTLEHAHRRLELLNEVSKVLAAFETAEQTIDHALGLVARTLSIRSAVLVVVMEGQRKMITWPSSDESREHLNAAIAHAEDAWAYFSGSGRADPQLDVQEGITSLPATIASEAGEKRRFVVIPLVVPQRPIFGSLQLEPSGALERMDVVFINAIANQLALALDRDLAWRREIALRKRADLGREQAETREASAERGRTAAEALRQRYEALVDNLDHAFLWEAEWEDADLRTLYVSARAGALLGYSRAEVMAAPNFWMDRVVPEDRGVLEAALVRARKGKGDQRCDYRCSTRDQRLRWFHTRIHLEAVPGHTPLLQGVSFDITPAKEAEGRLNEQLQYTRAIASSLGEGVITVDLEDRISFINRAAEDLLAWSGQDAVGRELRELVRVAAEDGRPVERPSQKVLRTGKPTTVDEHLFVRADDLAVPVQYTAAPIRREGRMTGAVLAFQDITARKQAAETQSLLLTASQALGASLDPQAAFDAIAKVALPRLGDFFFFDVVEPQGALRRAASLHHHPEKSPLLDDGEAGGALLERLVIQVVHSGRSEVVTGLDETWPAGGPLGPRERAFLTGRGARSLMTVPVALSERKLGALTFVFAESKRRHTQADLGLAEELARRAAFALENARHYEEARQATRDREQILSVVSHDLKNPLSTILLTCGSLLKLIGPKESGKPLVAKVDVVQRAADRMRRLIEDLLDFASIEAGRLKVAPKRFELAPLVEEMLASFEAVAHERGLRLWADLAPEAKGATLEGDRHRLLQVLGNLVGNATQIVPQGGEVSIHVERADAEWRFAVKDDGPGLSDEAKSRLFERYWREGKATYKGTGLGLSIARGIVLAHGGRIWAEGKEGEGATFHFTLPAKEV